MGQASSNHAGYSPTTHQVTCLGDLLEDTLKTYFEGHQDMNLSEMEIRLTERLLHNRRDITNKLYVYPEIHHPKKRMQRSETTIVVSGWPLKAEELNMKIFSTLPDQAIFNLAQTNRAFYQYIESRLGRLLRWPKSFPSSQCFSYGEANHPEMFIISPDKRLVLAIADCNVSQTCFVKARVFHIKCGLLGELEWKSTTSFYHYTCIPAFSPDSNFIITPNHTQECSVVLCDVRDPTQFGTTVLRYAAPEFPQNPLREDSLFQIVWVDNRKVSFVFGGLLKYKFPTGVITCDVLLDSLGEVVSLRRDETFLLDMAKYRRRTLGPSERRLFVLSATYKRKNETWIATRSEPGTMYCYHPEENTHFVLQAGAGMDFGQPQFNANGNLFFTESPLIRAIKSGSTQSGKIWSCDPKNRQILGKKPAPEGYHFRGVAHLTGDGNIAGVIGSSDGEDNDTMLVVDLKNFTLLAKCSIPFDGSEMGSSPVYHYFLNH